MNSLKEAFNHLSIFAGQSAEALFSPMFFTVDPSKRVYWVFILSSLVLAFFAYYSKEKKGMISLKGFLAFAFPLKVLLHPSAKLDYQLFFVNALIRFLIIAPLVFSGIPLMLLIENGLSEIFGRSNLKIDPLTLSITFTLALFVADDFSRFFTHLLLHKLPFLWHFHKVHHSAEVLTPITVYRVHPIESLIFTFRLIFVEAIVIGCFFYLFGTKLSTIDILGANIFTFAFNAFGSNLRHSHIALGYGKIVENIFISPSQHQIHHSVNAVHIDKNFGAFLAIWDLGFGSLVKSENQDELIFGVKGSNHHSIWEAYTLPFVELSNLPIKPTFWPFELRKET